MPECHRPPRKRSAENSAASLSSSDDKNRFLQNEDCTGKFSYSLSLPGGLSPTIEERFILFGNGREYRSIPTPSSNGMTTLAWIGEGHRISKPGEPLNTCGPQTAHGTYLMGVKNWCALAPIRSSLTLCRCVLTFR
jgi:hypothetical protein